MSQLFAPGGQSIRVSASASVLSMYIQGWFLIGLTGLISLLSKGLSRVFFSITIQKHQFFGAQPFYNSAVTSICDYWKSHSFAIQTFVGKVMSLIFNTLSRFVKAILPRSKCLLISWMQLLTAFILEPIRWNLTLFSHVPSICHEVLGPDAMIFVLWKLSFKPVFSLSSFTFIKRLFNSSLLSAIKVVSSAYLSLLIFLPAILIPAYDSSSLAFVSCIQDVS